MNSSIYGFLIMTVVITVTGQHADHLFRKVLVSVHYESLCPDSIRFITTQLYPAYYHLKSVMDVKFIPFGKSESINGGDGGFVCQHGPDECYGNMIQSCMINTIGNSPDRVMEYVRCQMDPNADRTGRPCVEANGVEWSEIAQCHDGPVGTQLQLLAEKDTHLVGRPYPKFVPTISYDMIFNQTTQNRSINDFVGVVCDLTNHIADVCRSL